MPAEKFARPQSSIRLEAYAAAIYGTLMSVALLLVNSRVQSALFALIFPIAAPSSTAAFVLFRALARRLSFRRFLVAALGLGTAIVCGGLYSSAGCFGQDGYCTAMTMIVMVFFAATVVIPAILGAAISRRFRFCPKVRGKVLAASVWLLFAAAAPGIWTAFGEQPFRALLHYDPLVAGEVLWRAVISDPGGEPGDGEGRVRRSVRAHALRGLPPAAQIEFARRNDATGASARAALNISLDVREDETKALLLAEIERQGGTASGPEAGWLFETIGSLATKDQQIEALLVERLTQMTPGEASSQEQQMLELYLCKRRNGVAPSPAAMHACGSW